MIATIVNCITVFVGSLLGVKLTARINEKLKEVLFICIGMISLVIGIRMGQEFTKTLYVVISLTIGGLIGYLLDIDAAIMRFGSFLERLVSRKSSSGNKSDSNFAHGFLNASVLFCVGAMTIVGSIKAGVEHDYELILTKSVMDGISAVIFAAGMGIGVAFSIISIMVIQGGLTLLAVAVGDFIPALVISEISGLGGVMIIMIGLNLLKIKDIKTANFLPSLLFVALLAAVDPYLPFSL
ncbi:MAG: DUF554 domain-containing protein [Spirochaetales bacterium]|uniref:DUF554 domain-containing protein n=1 Tax=Candidatus Thalassospirochaeta sargassi TaxID=3119039 RepID=A0AAJ1MNP8_9SPIO|nr:DUF554 domain-containing protein [Spirochaetales bacterium]